MNNNKEFLAGVKNNKEFLADIKEFTQGSCFSYGNGLYHMYESAPAMIPPRLNGMMVEKAAEIVKGNVGRMTIKAAFSILYFEEIQSVVEEFLAKGGVYGSI